MPETITITTYTYAELVEMVAVAEAVDRARDWFREAWADHMCESVSETLDTDLAETHPGAKVVEWDYYRGYVTVDGIEDDDERSEVEAALTKAMHAEVEYQDSEEYIAEAMEANGYTFTADGRRFG